MITDTSNTISDFSCAVRFSELLRLSLRRLFGVNKPNITRLNRKDDYYRDYYFNKRLSEGIEFIALIERISKKQAAEAKMMIIQ